LKTDRCFVEFREEWRLDTDFEIGKPLGEGKFGHVYLARTKVDKMIVALKVIHSKQIEETRMQEQINRETEIHVDLKYVHHHSLLRI
jgi:serine/threonine protein kinase